MWQQEEHAILEHWETYFILSPASHVLQMPMPSRSLAPTISAAWWGARWSADPYTPYAHLRNDPRISAADTLVAIDFGGPDVAMVTLDIGYPPCLYHDVLLMLRLSQPVSGRPGSIAGW
jgi:hypothetical protein